MPSEQFITILLFKKTLLCLESIIWITPEPVEMEDLKVSIFIKKRGKM